MKRLVLIAAFACLACTPPAGDGAADGAGGNAAAEAEGAAASGAERFYGQESFTIVMAHTGRQLGTTTTHVRDWGRRRVELNDTTLSVSGITARTNNRVIYDGARVITIEAGANAGTAITNPLYGQVVEAMRGRSGVEFGQQIMTQMGGRSTGESGSFAGHACDYWENASLGSRSCVTPWGATLHLRSNIGGITIEQTATEVRLGDGGPDRAFAYDAASITEGPNLGDIMGKMKGN